MAELTGHLGYEKDDTARRVTGSSCNGPSSKMILTDGEIELFVSRDRAGSLEPRLIAKGDPVVPEIFEHLVLN